MQIQTLLLVSVLASAVNAAPAILTREEPIDISNLPTPETIFTDAAPHTICGQWSARTGSGGIVNHFNQCVSGSNCHKPANSSIGLCSPLSSASGAVISTDGSCGYSGAGGAIENIFCPRGNSCQFADKKDLKGKCVTTPQDAPDVQPPPLKLALTNVKTGEACGLLIEPAQGKYTFAKCSAGLECNKDTDHTGTCVKAPVLAPAAVVGTDGRCGYSFDGSLMTFCAKGKCIIPDMVSLSGVCDSN
ncbi:hypothetical protein HDU97_008399 [Phlyctochytrium planicorne]|nr:hypothetical protein HDU97_008399 [Phlyctochytrium planicorne]